MSATLYEYDELGSVVKVCLDVDNDDSIDESETDRIIASDRYYEQDGSSDWWVVSSNGVYAVENTNTLTTTGYTKTRLTGLSTNLISESKSIDIFGNETISSSSVNRSAKTVTRTVNVPDSTNNQSQITINGMLISSMSKTGLEYQYLYDGLERKISMTHPKNGTNIACYDAKGQISYLEDSATNHIGFTYDVSTGRRIAITNALGKIIRYEFDEKGRRIKKWGNVVYPVSYAYDDFNQMISMSTYRDEANWDGENWPTNTGTADTTSWLYDEATGLLTNKLYSDENGIFYVYSNDNKLTTRIWGSSGIERIYSYDLNSGELTNISYSVTNTADISFSYDRLGRQEIVIDALGTRTFAYNSNLQLDTETIDWGDATNIITRSYATNGVVGRNTGFGLDSDYSVSYGFDEAGRFNSIIGVPMSGTTNSFSYSYLANSDLISQLIENNFNLTNAWSYEVNRDLVTRVENIAGTNQVSKYEYSNDAIGRRTQRIDTLSGITTNTFGYNDRSELISAMMGTNSYNYVFDNIGNRIATTNNQQVVTYLANELNQYSQIITNSITNNLSYDLNGNLISDGTWIYTWNGENRLICASNGSIVVSMEYDYMGRRISKTAGGVTTRFVYDGWNMIQESNNADTNRYIWGLDLSQTLQDVGGVGALLSAATESDGNSYFVFEDANGNVTDYVDINGAIVAHYDFDAYGNIISSAGSKKDDFLFRFSTKYFDRETGLYAYIFRDYSLKTARWLAREPLEENGGGNLYLYLNNDPISWVDYIGFHSVRRVNYGVEMYYAYAREGIKLPPNGSLWREINMKWLLNSIAPKLYKKGSVGNVGSVSMNELAAAYCGSTLMWDTMATDLALVAVETAKKAKTIFTKGVDQYIVDQIKKEIKDKLKEETKEEFSDRQTIDVSNIPNKECYCRMKISYDPEFWSFSGTIEGALGKNVSYGSTSCDCPTKFSVGFSGTLDVVGRIFKSEKIDIFKYPE